MIPSSLLVLLMLGPFALALLSLVDEALFPMVLAVDGGLALLAVVDALLASPRRVTVRREVRPVLSVGRANPVTLELRLSAGRELEVEITDDIFSESESEGLPGVVLLPAGGAARHRYLLTPRRRGAYELGAHTVRYPSPLRLWIRQLRIPASDPIRVYPDVQALRTYELLARQDRAASIGRASRQIGGESEFERLREYSRDDEFRAIDWKATARRQRLIARQYQLERNQTIALMIDGGRLMTTEVQGLPLFDHALNASLMLAHVGARGGDRVGLFAFSDRIQAALPPTAGRSATVRLVRATYDLHAEMVEPDYGAAFSRLRRDLRQRSLVVVFTQVHDDIAATSLVRYARGLLPLHLPLIVLLRDPGIEAMARVRSDDDDEALFRRAAAAEFLGWRDRLVRTLRGLGAHVLDIEPRRLTVDVVNRYLEIKARQLL